MALKGDRKITDGTDISFFCNTVVEKGEVLIFSTGGSGAAMDDANALVSRPADVTISGDIAAGIALNDMVNIDLTRQHVNFHRDEIQLGGKMTLVRRGVITTDMIASGDSPTIGQKAFFALGQKNGDTTSRGVLTVVAPIDSGSPPSVGGVEYTEREYLIGQFLSTKDADNFAKVSIDLE